jgi:hypothetical protein
MNELNARSTAAPPFFRTRPIAASSVSSSSANPCRIVFGSHCKTRAMYSLPPCSSLAASIAAKRRRSFPTARRKNVSSSAQHRPNRHPCHALWDRTGDRWNSTRFLRFREVVLGRILSVLQVSQSPCLPIRRLPFPIHCPLIDAQYGCSIILA